MKIKLEVDKIYKFTHKISKYRGTEESYFTARIVTDVDFEGDYRVVVIESTRPAYIEGEYSWFNENNEAYRVEELPTLRLGKVLREPEVEAVVDLDEIALRNGIIMNDSLYDVFVNMAIDTDDKEWLIELGNWKKSQKGVNV